MLTVFSFSNYQKQQRNALRKTKQEGGPCSSLRLNLKYVQKLRFFGSEDDRPTYCYKMLQVVKVLREGYESCEGQRPTACIPKHSMNTTYLT